jgi:hypothetical protein
MKAPTTVNGSATTSSLTLQWQEAEVGPSDAPVTDYEVPSPRRVLHAVVHIG